jgi:hypothetical protein
MKRFSPFLLVLLLPVAAFAQSQQGPDAKMLKQLGLNDGQVSQVLDIQGKTETAVRADAVQLRLLRAQLEKALLPANADMQSVNGIITQIGQARVDMQKTLVAARVQMRQIMGDDNFRSYTRYTRQEMRPGIETRRTMGRGRFHRGAMSGSGEMSERMESIQSF